MKKLTVDAAENLARKFRSEAQLSQSEPLYFYSLLQRMGIMVIFRPMSSNACGLSTMSRDKVNKYMLINSSRPLGRQRFTMAHEMYHLFFDENPEPHMCFENGDKDPREKDANMFASALIMPKDGLLSYIPDEELKQNRISLGTVMKLEQIFMVSHQAMCYRLKNLRLVTEDKLQQLLTISPAHTAWEFGYSTRIYDDGDCRKEVLGNFIAKAKVLLDNERISEGHYHELMNLIGDEKS